nr:hypothetical protein [Tanacetum cinerariifolium]
MASSSAPQIDYAPMVQQSSKYSPPEARLVVSVFQKGDDPIDAINHMMSFLTAVVTLRQGLVRGLPKLKFEKDHLCSACAMGKSTKKTHKPKYKDTNQESVNGKEYILVRLNVPVRLIRTNNGTEFVNQTLRDYYEEVGISHETSVARSPQQNGVVERRNRTLIEAARTMLI